MKKTIDASRVRMIRLSEDRPRTVGDCISTPPAERIIMPIMQDEYRSIKFACSTVIFLFLHSIATAQLVSFPPQKVGAFETIHLNIGQTHKFEFATSDGKPPFGGKPYAVECESRDSEEPPIWFRGFVPQGDNKPMIDTAVIFGGLESPPLVLLRVIVENKTVYRALIQINVTPPKPLPSPYTDEIRKGFLLDKDITPVALLNLSDAFTKVLVKLPTLNKGSDVWNCLNDEYKGLSDQTKYTRNSISTILARETAKYYDTVLTDASRKHFKQVLTDIKYSVDELAAGPKPDPGPGPIPDPVGPQKLLMVVVHETADMTPERAALLDDADLLAWFNSKGHSRLLVDKDVTGKTKVPDRLVPYLKRAEGKNLPWVVLVNQQTGKLQAEFSLPTTVSELKAILEKWGGK